VVKCGHVFLSPLQNSECRKCGVSWSEYYEFLMRDSRFWSDSHNKQAGG